MSLLTLFAQQRKLWQSQAPDQAADYQTGGLAALDQAEAAFKGTPLYNAHQRLADTQRELEEVSYQLSVARKKIKSLEVNTTPGQVKAMASLSLLKHHRSQAYKARKALRQVVELANHPQMDRDKKLRKLVELVSRFLASPQGQEGEEV